MMSPRVTFSMLRFGQALRERNGLKSGCLGTDDRLETQRRVRIVSKLLGYHGSLRKFIMFVGWKKREMNDSLGYKLVYCECVGVHRSFIVTCKQSARLNASWAKHCAIVLAYCSCRENGLYCRRCEQLRT